MARLALEHALPAGWVDDVFEAHRQRQYSHELLFSTVVKLTTLVSDDGGNIDPLRRQAAGAQEASV